ncbi:WD40 repeat-like protein [Lichtheimia hyalospora FSU 10163]|nr:WD40 repeat-like protein [Lichtheimia hyalospora FSU 10163]
MIISKPHWISHAAEREKGVKPAIYSIHVHPDGKRIATGSLDTTVRIWNTEPIFDETAESNPDCHKLLCTLARHSGAVLCVRWSNNEGHYLASSSDNDNVIIIWESEGDSFATTVFGSSEVNYETWRPKQYLRGHDSDVQDLAWSRDNEYLASGSVDGSVIVWNGTTFDQVRRIEEQGGFVKGITWDPVGKFIAAQYDNKMLKIWRTSDWNLEQEIRAPFVNAPSTTFFRRLSWAPTGTQIVTANATNGAHCVAAIISREEWVADVSLVGHKCPIEVASFNPHLFYLGENGENPVEKSSEHLSTVCALGGQDRSISLWTTKFERPLAVATDIFEGNVYDLSWTPDGQALFACAHDGTVACIRLPEFADQIAPEDQVLRQLAAFGYNTESSQLPESTLQLNIEDTNTKQQKSTPAKRFADLMGETTETLPSPNGKLPDNTSSTTTTTTANTTTTTQEQTSSTTAQPSRPADADFTSSSSNQPTVLQQTVTVGKDGKRRIKPVTIRSSSSTVSPGPRPASPKVQSVQHTGTVEARPAANVVRWADGITYDFPESNIPASGIGSVVVGNKRDAMQVDQDTPPRKRPAWIDSALLPPAAAQSQVRLGVPKIRSNFVWTPRGNDKQSKVILMECDNHNTGTNTSTSTTWDCARLSISSHGKKLWQDYLPSAIMLMSGCHEFYAAACEDGSVHVYSSAGRRILPPMVLESTIVLLRCSDPWLVCLTATGLLYTWDVSKLSSRLDGVSIAPLLRVAQIPGPLDEDEDEDEEEEEDEDEEDGDDGDKDTPKIKDVRIQKNGLPLVITNYQQAFTYHLGMKVWLRISDAWYIVSEFWNSSLGHPRDYPLGWLSAAMTLNGGLDPIGKVMLNFVEGNKEAVGAITLSHIEIQLAVAALLNSKSEYRQWLKIYAKKLSVENAQEKVKELCHWLIGPPLLPCVDGRHWEPTVMDSLSKQDLLRDILPLLGTNRQLQRLVNEYNTYINSPATL